MDKLIRFFFKSTPITRTSTTSPTDNCLQWMFDYISRSSQRYAQSILMYTDIDKCPKINYITYGSFKDHAFFQVLHIKYICSQYRLRHLITRISCRFFQLFDNITKCRFTNAKLFCQFL